MTPQTSMWAGKEISSSKLSLTREGNNKKDPSWPVL